MASPAPDTVSADAAPVKVRKPRGRKPKHVKLVEEAAAAQKAAEEATAAAQAAMGRSIPSSTSSSLKEEIGVPSTEIRRTSSLEDIPPGITVHHRGGGGSVPQLQQVGGNGGGGGNRAIPSPFQQGAPPPNNSYRQGGGGQMSLEQPARHDRAQIILMRRKVTAGVAPTNATTNSSTPGFLNIQQFQQQQQQTPTSSHRHHHHQAYQYASPPSSTNQTSHPPPQHHHPNYQSHPPSPSNGDGNGGGRLDQFFSSRIPAPSNKCIFKPKIIEANSIMYKLLTAPITPRPGGDDFDNSKERWTQYPNPSVIPNGNKSACEGGSRGAGDQGDLSSSRGGGGGGDAGSFKNSPAAAFLQNHQERFNHRLQAVHAASPLAQDSTAGGDPQGSRYVIGRAVPGVRIYIGRDGIPPGEMSLTTGLVGEVPTSRSGAAARAGYQYYSSTQFENLENQVETLVQENDELKRRVNWITKMYQRVIVRLCHAYEQNQEMKFALDQNSQFSRDLFGLGGRGGRGGGGSMILGNAAAFENDGFSMREGGGRGGNSGGSDDSYYDNLELIPVGRGGAGERGEYSNSSSWLMRRMPRANSVEDARLFLDQRDADMSPGPATGTGRAGGGGNLKRNMEEEGGSCTPPLMASKKLCGYSGSDATAEKTGCGGGGGDGSAVGNISGPGGVGWKENKAFVNLPTLKEEILSPPAEGGGERKEMGGGGNGGSGSSGDIDSSPSVETDIVTGDEGENTCSTMFHLPCSVGSHSFAHFAPSSYGFVPAVVNAKVIPGPIFKDVATASGSMAAVANGNEISSGGGGGGEGEGRTQDNQGQANKVQQVTTLEELLQ